MNSTEHDDSSTTLNSGQIENLNVIAQEVLPTPEALKRELPLTAQAQATVTRGRDAVRAILDRRDPRLLVVVGPCSIHDVDAAHDYARRLQALAEEVEDSLLLVMRVYFEKPRTTVGWKGLINDPYLNDSFRIEEGLHIGRRLLLDLSELGLPLATEALDPISPQYLQDLISWSAIGARTTESQTHREMASGLSSAVGFKNGTDGGLEVAINALKSTSRPHRFLGINAAGQVAVIHTRGNGYGHVVLRGGSGGPNHDADSVAACERALEAAGIAANLMIDCSHANSAKDPGRQPLVLDDLVSQIEAGNRSIIGTMIESNIEFGNQPLSADRTAMRYGVSVTDGCIDWETTATCLRDAATRLRAVLPERMRALDATRAAG
ncbi:MAG TPA: 3-deoxy-7-phosphoheptulonate synthase [Pseudomonadales bacterium]|nr:3-deoxy-7-phosphoheptulonate synthase [Pseudomonadales bacterium]